MGCDLFCLRFERTENEIVNQLQCFSGIRPLSRQFWLTRVLFRRLVPCTTTEKSSDAFDKKNKHKRHRKSISLIMTFLYRSGRTVYECYVSFWSRLTRGMIFGRTELESVNLTEKCALDSRFGQLRVLIYSLL